MNSSLPSMDASAVSAIPVWLYWVIGILVVLALIFFLILPLYRKFRRKRLKVKETTEIKKDLMIWHHLAQLVRGGTEHQKAKQALSGQIITINNAFKQGAQMLVAHNRKRYELPWFVLLGEPFSGKSSLLRNSELEMIASAEEEAIGESEKKEIPLRLWLGAKAVVCDVNGKVFFDRWLNGSSAEWSYICRLLRRKRFKRPLDGIIITIPADALLADDEVLTQQKAVLITTEIGQLLHTVGMNLPCYIVVTKTDMINGFDEYVMGINEELRSQIFGWVNEKGLYKEEAFKQFWEDLIARLHAGCEKSMLSRNVATKLSTLSNRMEVTGKIYLFPENFNELYKNLSVYLRALFGEGNFHGADNVTLEGVFFTSAKDGDVTLSPSFARLCDKKVDEAPIPREPNPRSRPFFIRDMLNKFVFRRSGNAFFTVREKIKRNIPKYLLCLAMTVVGSIWLSAAYFQREELNEALVTQSEFYTVLAEMLGRGNVFASPLIKRGADGKYELNSDPIVNESVSRLQYFFELFADRETPNEAPFGFQTASLAVFGEKNMGYADKAFIFNQMVGIMVRTPVIHAVGDKLTASGTDSELTQIKRDAIDSFTVLNMVKDENYASVMMPGQFNLKTMLAYLLPSLSNDMSNLVTSFLPRYDKKYTNTIDPLYIHSEDFIEAQETGLKAIVEAWKKLNAYPGSVYAKIRKVIRLSTRIKQRDEEMAGLMKSSGQIFDSQKLKAALDQWNTLLKQQNEDMEQMNLLLAQVRESMPAHLVGKDNAGKKDAKLKDQSFLYGNVPVSLMLRYYSRQYEGMLRDDFDFADERVGQFMTANWDPYEWRKTIRSIEKSSLQALSAELGDLHKNIDALQNVPLYHWQLIEKQGASGYLYDILNGFYAEALKLKSLSQEEIEKNDFKTNWMKTQQTIKENLDRYDAAVKPFAGNDQIAQAAAGVRKMMLLQAQADRYAVLHNEIERLPADKTEMEAYVSANAFQEKLFDFSTELAQETFGDFSYDLRFSPKTVKQMVENVFVVAGSFLKNKKDVSAAFLNDCEHYEKKLAVFDAYLGSFIEYWGTYPDRVYKEAASWDAFKKQSGKMKAFKINSLLRSVYAQSLEVLKSIDDTAISEELKKAKSKYIAILSDRISMLTPLYTDVAQKMMNSWAEMPDSAEEAWKRLISLTDKELKSTLFRLKTDGERGQIAWWENYTANGVDLLKRENENALKKALADVEEEESTSVADLKKGGKSAPAKKKKRYTLLDDMSAFPLCRDCNTGRTLTPDQMQKLVLLLKNVVSEKPEGDAKKQEPALFDKQLSLFPDQESSDWAANVFKIASALTNEKTPLVWTLYQAPIETQTGMLSDKEISAVNRFRYVEVNVGNAKKAKRFGTSSEKETLIGQGRAASPITLRFYKSSADSTPEAQISLGGFWSVFRIYLRNGGFIDAQTNRLYVPLTVKDQSGAKFVYLVGVKLNVPLMKPDEWPTRKNRQAAVASIKTASAEE